MFFYDFLDGPRITSLTINSQSSKVIVDELTPMTVKCDVVSNPGSTIKLLNNSHTLLEMENSKWAQYSWMKARCLDTQNYACEAGNGTVVNDREIVQLIVRCKNNCLVI